MSEHVRGYFSLRYAIPGYTFILLLIGINYVPLFKILPTNGFESAFGAFLAFLALLSGSAIGFLVSQFWWWRFQRNIGLLGIKGFKHVLDVLVQSYKLVKPCDERTKRKILAVFDYVSHSEKREKLFTLVERRWDMYHLLSSTYYTLWIASAVGIVCRIYCVLLLQIPLVKNTEFIALTFIFVIVAFLLFFLYRGRQWISTEYIALSEARIRSSDVTPTDIKKAFPDIIANNK